MPSFRILAQAPLIMFCHLHLSCAAIWGQETSWYNWRHCYSLPNYRKGHFHGGCWYGILKWPGSGPSQKLKGSWIIDPSSRNEINIISYFSTKSARKPSKIPVWLFLHSGCFDQCALQSCFEFRESLILGVLVGRKDHLLQKLKIRVLLSLSDLRAFFSHD